MTEYVDDELPLPPFAEIFGEGSMSNKKKSKKFEGARGDPNNDETTGRWTQEEHRLFLEGIMLYGKDWKKMQPLIKTRTLVQIRTHAQKVFKKIGLKKLGAGSKSKAAALAAAAAASGNHHLMETINSQQHDLEGMAHQNLMGMYPNGSNNHHHFGSTGSEQHGMTASMMMPISTSSSSHQHHNNGASVSSVGAANHNGLMHHQLLQQQQQSQYYGNNGLLGGHDRSHDASVGRTGGLLGESEEDQDHFRDVIRLAAQADDGDHPSYTSAPSSSSGAGMFSGTDDAQGLTRINTDGGVGGSSSSSSSAFKSSSFPLTAVSGAYNQSLDPLLGQFGSAPQGLIGQYLSGDSAMSPHGMFGAVPGGSHFSLLGPDASTSLLAGYLESGGGSLLPHHFHNGSSSSNSSSRNGMMSNAAAADMLNSLNGEEEEGEDDDDEDLDGVEDEDDDDDNSQQMVTSLLSGPNAGSFNLLQQTANSFQHQPIHPLNYPQPPQQQQNQYMQPLAQQQFHSTSTAVGIAGEGIDANGYPPVLPEQRQKE